MTPRAQTDDQKLRPHRRKGVIARHQLGETLAARAGKLPPKPPAGA